MSASWIRSCRAPCCPSTSGKHAARAVSVRMPCGSARRSCSRQDEDNQSIRDVSVKGTLEDSLPGWTPWEFISFDEKAMEHEAEIQIKASKDKVYQMLLDRVLVTKCLKIYDEHYVYVEDEDVCDFRLYYRWTTLPALQLMFTIQRYDKSPGEGLKFASILGMPVTGSFELREEGSSTILAMQVKYQLPSLLGQFVGELPVWGDVDDMLTDALEEFKKLAEADA